MNTGTSAGPPPEMSDLLTDSLAVGMGFVLGAILGAPQWWVLRYARLQPSFLDTTLEHGKIA
jgi:hypothetical protein